MAENKTQEKINQLQIYEQSLQTILLQKQQFQSQINEITTALSELKNSPDAYKIIGNIMVKTDKAELTKDLESKKSSSELRIKTLEKQENNIRDKMQSIQAEVMKGMEAGE